MNKAAIKNFAIEARKKLIASVKDKAGRIGITKNSITDPISKGEGYAIFPTHIGIETKLMGKEVKQRENLVNRVKSKENGYDLVMEEVAYTWFNRLIAIRFMEVNDYLPARVRVLSSETAGKFEPDIVTQAPDIDLELSQAEIEEVLTLKEKNAMDELFRRLFIKQCNELGKILPELFENTSKENSDYTEILLDISYTNEDGVFRDLLKIDEADFLEAVEIIGWLYQYYNTEPKDETFALLKKNVKITKERIPAATQLFTPDWIVRYMVENSLGRLWLEGHPDSNIKDNWKYYLDEAEQEADVKAELDKFREERKNLRPEDIRVIDPCMGSGHILVYAFDVLMDIYKACGYTEQDAAKLILQYNLYGLDIDDRAYQLAYFAVMMKARAYSRRILNEGICPHIGAIQESNGIPKQEVMDIFARLVEGPLWSDKLRDDVEYLIDVFRDAKEYGSILEIKPIDFAAIEEAVEAVRENKAVLNIFEAPYKEIILHRMPMLVEQSKILVQKYDVIITNPPYMGSGGMGPLLSEYVRKKYPDTKSDISTVFMEKTLDMCKHSGSVSMINIPVWMFIGSYEKLRKNIICSRLLINMLHFGRGVFGADFGTTAFVISRYYIKNYQATYRKLYTRQGSVDSIENKEKYFFEGVGRFLAKQKDFSKIPGMPISYWVSDKVLGLFKYPLIRTRFSAKEGVGTRNDEAFLRLFWEVEIQKISKESRWVLTDKAGMYRKWYLGPSFVMDWENDGQRIKNYRNPDGTLRSRPQNLQYLFRKGISWGKVGSGITSFRFRSEGYAFNDAAPTLFGDDEMPLLAALNSKLFSRLLNIRGETINVTCGVIEELPLLGYDLCRELIIGSVSECIKISKNDWDNYETSYEFKRHPLMIYGNDTKSIANAFDAWSIFNNCQFAQMKSNEEEINRVFINEYGFKDELKPDVDDREVSLQRAEKARDIKSFISYAVGCIFGRYNLDIEGLAYAGGEWDDSKYITFLPDTDNILPITDEEYFTDDIVIRFAEFVKVVYGQENLEENLDCIAQALGNKGTTSREIIRNYFLKDFYADHVKVYQKRPIYWLFDSGKENGFKALIYMHRYNQDTVGRVRADYLHKAQAFIENAIANSEVVMESNAPAGEKAKAVKQKEKLVKQLAETRLYDQAIAHIAHQRITIDLDDGVVVNYAKFQGVEVANEGKKAVKIDLLAKI
ncbi:BREX-1 system adenine-specific DNA-methyltransferase PglX [Sporomusa sphaeroides]|uniref:BREX-1 system adenine-specific DNA-methyltransferase PglX n=1 Tax=Sporomusa sphaeroides TaxID=47679 RepID=UPI003158CE53